MQKDNDLRFASFQKNFRAKQARADGKGDALDCCDQIATDPTAREVSSVLRMDAIGAL